MQTSVSPAEPVLTYEWQWENQTIKVAYARRGQGVPVLLLPAFSTVSSRREWDGVIQVLARFYEVTTVDWPGFGESSRPNVTYNPVLYSAFLQDFVTMAFAQPFVLVAAGHAAGYALTLAEKLPKTVARLILVAPTWRGPLPTMGAPSAVAHTLQNMVKLPVLGPFLYYLNTRPRFLTWMYQRHVFVDATLLTPDFMHTKYRTTQQRGARFGPAAFVTGGLDPVTNRGAFLQLFQGLRHPCLVITSADGPPKSKAEMAAISQVPQVTLQEHPGSLGLHEEYGTEVARLIQKFLQS
jgi:pimeloyl-ACP methyl ester carboxylesterase